MIDQGEASVDSVQERGERLKGVMKHSELLEVYE
jgi:hypothetical protein